MSSRLINHTDEKIVEVELSGKLDHQDYQEFVPALEQRIQRVGKLRLLVNMIDFHGWTAAALWDDLKFDFKHFNDIERLAMVGDAKWEEGMAAFCKPFTSAEVRYFDAHELQSARRWIAEEAGA